MDLPHQTARLLLIDDEVNLLLGLKGVMVKAGYTVYTASNGTDGLRLAAELLPDLIVCDVMMPPPDGFKVKTELAKNVVTATIPFIFLTARSGTTDKLIGFKEGADDYITKPFEVSELLARVEALLRRAEASRLRGRQEAETKIDELRHSISANLSHEMRTPVSMVIGTLELAMRDKFSGSAADQDWYIKTALSSAVRLQQLTEDLIMLNDIDQNKISTFREEIDLKYHFLDPVQKTIERYKDKNLILKSHIDEGVKIHAPRNGFILAIHHLIDNACKFSPAGGTIYVYLAANGMGGCVLNIQDEGPGIPPALKEKVFERYHQVQQGDARQFDGLGLGLTLARAFARAQTGEVKIVDSPRGCRVMMTMPPAPLEWIKPE